jgi:enoyl-CoA hydratase
LVELGLTGFDTGTTHGFWAPGGTPQPIIDRVNAEINKALLLPAVVEAIRALGAEPTPMSPAQFDTVSTSGGFDREGAEGYMAWEEEVYFQMCWRWRNLPKPLIAAAQGKTIAGGLMLLWVADVIVASDDALFSDPVVGMGVNGVEYFAHPWEFGARKAKELLFTGDWVTAEQARELGMVNHVVPRDDLRPFVMAMADRIAQRPSFALKLAKESVNQALEAQGQFTALRAAFSLQHLGHTHNRVRFGLPIDPGTR